MKPDENDKRAAKSLRRLADLAGEPPRTSTGKVVWAWPQISAALQRGWRMFDVWSALRENGIDIPYDSFRVYVSRLRRGRLPAARSIPVPEPAAETVSPAPETPTRPAAAPQTTDPYAGIRAQRKLKQEAGFEYDPFSTNKDLFK
jgi:hypothetical protein